MTAPMLDMNPEIRARWTAALRSGGYKQGREALRERDPDGGPDAFCCLGVLCELAVNAGIAESSLASPPDDTLWYYDGRGDYLPASVREWAGLYDSNPEVTAADGGKYPLAWLNDEGFSFAKIADAIDGSAS